MDFLPVPIRVEISPDNAFNMTAEGVIAASTLADTVNAKYFLCLHDYEEAISNWEQLDSNLRSCEWPSLWLVFDPDEETTKDKEAEEIIVFDESLFATLFDTYVFGGWDDIRQIQEALLDYTSRVRSVLPVLTFFYSTCDLIAMLIQESLIEIEGQATGQIVQDLGESARQINSAWLDKNKFFFCDEKNKKETTRARPDLTSLSGEYTLALAWWMQNVELAQDLYETMKSAVAAKFVYEDAVDQLTNIRSELLHVQTHVQTEYGDPGAGFRSPYPESGKNRQDRLKSEEQLQKHVVEKARVFDEGLRTIIAMNCPLALLAVDGLPREFAPLDMENMIGETLWMLHAQIDLTVKAMNSASSKVLAFRKTFDARIGLYNPGPGWKLEEFLIDHAISQVVDDPGYLALLSEATWHKLVQSSVIDKGRFNYIVYGHYIRALSKALEKARQTNEEQIKALSRVSAALSIGALASLTTPQTAPFSPLLRTASFVTSLIVLGNTIYSVTGRLASFDRMTALQLVRPDAFAISHLARLGELGSMRSEYLDNITQEVAMALVTVVLDNVKWPLVKLLMFEQGFFADLTTLAELWDVEHEVEHEGDDDAEENYSGE